MPLRTRILRGNSPGAGAVSILNMMRRTTLAFLTASLAIHAGMGGAAYVVSKMPHVDHLAVTKPAFAGETFEIAAVGARSRRVRS